MSKGVHNRAINMLAANQKKQMRAVAQRDEIFKRMKLESFVTLVLQTAQVELEESLLIQALTHNHTSSGSERTTPRSKSEGSVNLSQQRSTLMSVISGEGESDFLRRGEGGAEASTSKITVTPTRPYLLLDVRDDDEFAAGHILTASNYPSSLLSRASNFETPELLAYKNRPGKLIIVYDSCEKESPRVASTLIQRGYDNIALLSGGIHAAINRYPNGLYTGRVPPEILSPSGERSKKPTKIKSTAMKKITSVPNIAVNLKKEFTAEDLEFLREQLQFNLLPKGSRSRLVRNTIAQNMRNEDSVRQRKQAKNIAFRQHSYTMLG